MESVALKMRKPRSRGRSVVLGLLLIAGGAASEVVALGATVAGRFTDHQAQIAARSADRDAARQHAADVRIAARALDEAWTAYDAKILGVETRFGEPTSNDRAFIATFRERVIDQFADAGPALALATTAGDIAGDADFQASRTAFLAAFHDVRNQMYLLTASMSVVLEHPAALPALAQSGRFESFFAAEATLENTWTPVARAARRVSETALAAEQTAEDRFDAEQRRTPLDVLLAR